MSLGSLLPCRAGESGNGQMGAVATAAVAALAVLTRSNRANRCTAVLHNLARLHTGLPLLKAHSSGQMLTPDAGDCSASCCQPQAGLLLPT